MTGRFISFEGIDGCGKTTQTRLLASYCEKHHIPYLLTREPGGEESAERLRELLLNSSTDSWEVEAEILLFLAARVQHVRRVIQPALQQGTWVICDRFMDSTRVYQAAAHGQSYALYDTLHRLILGNFVPDMTFLLDIAVDISADRTKARREKADYFESRGTVFYEKLRAGFLSLAAKEPQRIFTIDATLPETEIHAYIIKYLC
jgi:dTMP kinase